MRWPKNIFCFVLIGSVAFAATFCCCAGAAAAKVLAAPTHHSCCPSKAKGDSASDQQFPSCSHQFYQAEKASLTSYESPLLVKAFDDGFTVVLLAPAAHPSLDLAWALSESPPRDSSIPLYLKSHSLRL